MKFTRATAAWAVTGALGLATIGAGASAVLTNRPSDENRPGIVLESGQPSGQPGQRTMTESAETPPTAPPTSRAPSTKASSTKPTTVRTTSTKATKKRTTVKRTTATSRYTAPAPVSADSPQSADSG